MPGDCPYRDKAWMREKYVGEDLTDEEIGDICGVNFRTINKWRQKLGVEKERDRRYRDKGWFREKYIEEGLTQEEIADWCDVQPYVISEWRTRHGIERRYNIKDDPIPGGGWLREEYVEKRRPSTDIADELGVSPNAVLDRIRSHGIQVRERGWDKRKQKAAYAKHQGKYPAWRDRGEGERVFVHSLLAIHAGHDPHKVFSKKFHVHHPLNPPGDVVLNVDWNVQLLTDSEHAKVHDALGVCGQAE